MLIYSIDSRSSFEEARQMYTWIAQIRDQEMPVVNEIYYNYNIAIIEIMAINGTML